MILETLPMGTKIILFRADRTIVRLRLTVWLLGYVGLTSFMGGRWVVSEMDCLSMRNTTPLAFPSRPSSSFPNETYLRTSVPRNVGSRVPLSRL